MKIHYSRYTEMSCLSIRGAIGPIEWRMLRLGFALLFKELEETLVINLLHATIPPEILANLLEQKKGIPQLTKQTVYTLSTEKSLGDFPKFELLLSRLKGTKMRHIGDHLILDDEIYALEEEIITIEAQILKLGFDENSSKKEIQKNIMAKTKKEALDHCLKWQKERKLHTKKVPCEVDDLEIKIKSAHEEIAKTLGKPIDL